MRDRELIHWTCPECGIENIDLQDDFTHCAACGEVVWVMNEDELFEDQKYSVPLEMRR